MTRKRYTTNPHDALMTRFLIALDPEARPAAPALRELFEDLLIDDVGDFGNMSALTTDEPRSDPLTWSAMYLHGVLAGLRTDIRHFVFGGDFRVDLGTMQVEVAPSTSQPGASLLITGTAEQVVIFKLVMLIRAVGRKRILECDCKRLFIKTGRREYCSERCQKRVYMRGFWATQLKKKKVSSGKTTRKR